MEESRNEMAQLAVDLVNKSNIASIKQVVSEILRIIKDEKSSAKDLTNMVEKDPPLCARLLKLANSALYGFPRTIGDMQEAIVCIGFDGVKELALSQKVYELFANNELREGYSRQLLWKHCLAVAICSKMIYRRELARRGDDIYTGGLLHDIGIIVEDQFFPELFAKALKRAAQEKRNLIDVETETLNINHSEIGKAIAINWEFPDELIQALAWHHSPEMIDEEFEIYGLTVYVANYVCQREKIGYVDSFQLDVNQYNECLSKLKIKNKAIDIIAEELKEELIKLEQSGLFRS